MTTMKTPRRSKRTERRKEEDKLLNFLVFSLIVAGNRGDENCDTIRAGTESLKMVLTTFPTNKFLNFSHELNFPFPHWEYSFCSLLAKKQEDSWPVCLR